MNEIREDIQLIVVAKEFSTKSGSIDVLALDESGEIYVIETKLYKNPNKRTVVAQALDYGASLWRQYATGSQFLNDLRQSVGRIADSTLEQHVADHLAADEEGVQEVLEAVVENLNEGSFNFVVLMDRMDDRLKDLIAFVNENSRFSLYGVELDFYQHDDLEIVIPRMYGAEVKKEVATSRSRRRSWDEASFFEDASERLTSHQVRALRQLYAYFREAADVVDWGTGATTGSFNPKFLTVSETKSVVTVKSDGQIALNFGWLEDTKSGRRFTAEFGPRVTAHLGLRLPQNYEEQYPQFRVGEWADNVDGLIEALEQTLRALEDSD